MSDLQPNTQVIDPLLLELDSALAANKKTDIDPLLLEIDAALGDITKQTIFDEQSGDAFVKAEQQKKQSMPTFSYVKHYWGDEVCWNFNNSSDCFSVVGIIASIIGVIIMFFCLLKTVKKYLILTKNKNTSVISNNYKLYEITFLYAVASFVFLVLLLVAFFGDVFYIEPEEIIFSLILLSLAAIIIRITKLISLTIIHKNQIGEEKAFLMWALVLVPSLIAVAIYDEYLTLSSIIIAVCHLAVIYLKLAIKK